VNPSGQNISGLFMVIKVFSLYKVLSGAYHPGTGKGIVKLSALIFDRLQAAADSMFPSVVSSAVNAMNLDFGTLSSITVDCLDGFPGLSPIAVIELNFFRPSKLAPHEKAPILPDSIVPTGF
jgi:hypothetical protein